MEFFNSLNLTQIKGGTKLKQGDLGSVLSYSLTDENGQEITSFDNKTAYINLVLDDKIWFTTTTLVNISRVTFRIDKAIPIGLYYLEIKIDDYIFPSDRDSIILIEEGSTPYDLKELVPNYDVNMTLKGILSDLSQKGVDISDLNRQLAEKANKDEVTNVMTPRGSIAYASLPMTGNSVGWYYYCPDGDGTNGAGNYVWNGTSWYFGGTGDEGYNLLKEDLVNKIDKPNKSDNNKFPRAKNGNVEWVEHGLPTDEQTESAVNNWLNNHPEATTTVQNHSLTKEKFANGVLPYVTPEMFGAVGDGVTDDTNAVQDCLNNSNKFKVLVGNYKITNSLIITGNGIKILGTNSRINYNGIGSAIIITKLRDSVIELGFITSQGNGIEIKSTSDNEWSQYTDIHFRFIDCVKKAIYFNTTAGWTSEIRIYDGKLNSGKFGIHADAHNRNGINNITIQNVGIEGVETGFYLANNINSWNIVNPRYHESYETLFETVGMVSSVNFFGSGMFYYDDRCKFSNSTRMSIYAPLTKNGGSILDAFGGRIINGCVVFNSHRDYINSINSENVIIGTNQCVNYILSGINLKSIKLNASYGTDYGVNEFYVNNASDNIISIYKNDGTVITSNVAAWSKYKFTYINSLGWVYKKLTMTETHVN